MAGLGTCVSLACAARPSVDEDGTETGAGTTEGSSCEEVDVAPIPPLAEPDSCNNYLLPDTPPWAPGEFVISNHSDQAIIVFDQSFGCHQPPRPFSLGGEYEDHAIELPLGGCAIEWPACQLYMDPSVSCQECASSFLPVYIEPGGSWRGSWDPWVTIEVTLPAACSSSDKAEACSVPIAPPPGSYAVQALAAYASECEMVDCTCEANEDGTCPAEELPDVGPSLTADGVWTAGCGVVELAFTG